MWQKRMRVFRFCETMNPPKEVEQLVERFDRNKEQYPLTTTTRCNSAANAEQEKTVIQRQIEATDKQIDQLVYELYGLTEEEIKIVEGSS